MSSSEEKWGRQQTKWYTQKVPFYDEDYLYQGLYRDYVCQVSKLQHMYAIALIPLSMLETTIQTKTYQI